MKISLCLITLNELQGCILDVPKIDKSKFYEIFVIDGGSTDGTFEFFVKNNISIFKQSKKGLNAAYIEANQRAVGDAVIVFFPKGTLDVSILYEFEKYFELGNELVIASRQINGSINEEDAKLLRFRKWAVYILSLIASMFWRKEGYRIRDVLHGVKGWKRESFFKMEILDFGISIDLEMVVRSYRLKFKRIEFPVVELPRHYGKSHFAAFPTGIKLLKYLIFELKRKNIES